MTELYKAVLGDTVQAHDQLEDNEIDMYIFSPPFAELYVYSDKPEDMGNVRNYNEFFEHFSYLIPKIKRTLKPGRVCVIHCMDLPIQKGKEGYIGVRDFPGMITRAFQDQGFIYNGRVTIWKNPVVEMQRTKALGLLHKQVLKDASFSRVGIPDYLLILKNEGDNPVPVVHQKTDPQKANYISVDEWQKIASPVWDDINYSNTLQFRKGRDEKDEKHICPLQCETVDRVIKLWSNEGEVIADPFGGIGTSAVQALKQGRKAWTSELKESYYELMQENINEAVIELSRPSIFDVA